MTNIDLLREIHHEGVDLGGEATIRHDLTTGQKFRFKILRVERHGGDVVIVTDGNQLEAPHESKPTK